MNKKMVSNLLIFFLGTILGGAVCYWLSDGLADKERKASEGIAPNPHQPISNPNSEIGSLQNQLKWARVSQNSLLKELEDLRFECSVIRSNRAAAEQKVEELKDQLKLELQESYKKDQRIVELQLLSVKLSKELLEQVEHQNK